MADRASNQVVIRLDQRLFYAIIAIVGVVALFGVGLYIGRLTSGAGRAAAPAAVAQSQSPLALPQGQPLPQAGAQPVAPVNSAQTGGANPFQQPQGAQAPVSASEPFGTDPRINIPEIKAKAYTWDFGDVKPDQKVEKVLQLTNEGKGELVIDNVTASCGCTAAVVSADKIAAGGSTDLRVGYDPRVNKDQGKFITRKVQVKYHFADEPNVTKQAEFTITANVTN